MKYKRFEISHTSRFIPHGLGIGKQFLSRNSSSLLILALILLSCFLLFLSFIGVAAAGGPAREAPAGFDKLTNGFVSQAAYDSARAIFEQRETIASGLGPIYNGESCVECHRNPVSGGNSIKTVLRAGHEDPATGLFVPAPGGTLMHVHAINPAIDLRVPDSENIRSTRKATSILGDGYVEAIDDSTLLAIANSQREKSNGRIAGVAVMVPVAEAGNILRVGRFGWKSQHASVVSFSADAYINEEGITNRYFPTENTALGKSVADYDSVPDPEDERRSDGFSHVDRFVDFIRATKAPPRDEKLAATPEARAGERVFEQIGCVICHVASITTAPVATKINGGQFTLPEALGDKVIHPYSDFLLHTLGTGDGVPVQSGGQSTANKMRTAPLWGLRTRSELMHDGASPTPERAILRHGGEAQMVIVEFLKLSPQQKKELFAFLSSL
jgi:CxxC motif-containing protein (DUF1111 family)